MSRCERQQSSANSTRSWFDLLTMTLRPSKGQRPGDLRFRFAQGGIQNSPALVDELKGHVAKKIGPIARPDEIYFAAELPKHAAAR